MKTVGRKASINSQEIIAAALNLVGPHRSISSLSLREVTREAGIAPNSFYRHFKDVDELNIAIIELAGQHLRAIIRDARSLIINERSVVRVSVECFFNEMRKPGSTLPILLREGTVGSGNFQDAIKKQLDFFAHELQTDLERANSIAPRYKTEETLVVAKAVTQLVFAMGGNALNTPESDLDKTVEETVLMVKFILKGASSSKG
ncbi:HTH-type transcriptional repressor FabR [Psychrosphaera aestuarii]|uniref:HTH-type transcriptional repressor FabR n=1 Tax=Psychrosphaera aestuarii TaxID=1266052 RepID=UPI001B326C72|nr:HTH-type transcriptional repressor FabR [Psychrosphaera aestuarii]